LIKLLGKVPRKFILALSGGHDSMHALSFLKNNHDIIACYVQHSDQQIGLRPVYRVCEELEIELIHHVIPFEKPKQKSWEEHWRDERYKILHSFELPVVMCHHLDDCIETWIWSCMHGTPKIIPYRNKNVIRPFLACTKEELGKQKTYWESDPTSEDESLMRNYIRRNMVSQALRVNPGLPKVIRKKVLTDFHES